MQARLSKLPVPPQKKMEDAPLPPQLSNRGRNMARAWKDILARNSDENMCASGMRHMSHVQLIPTDGEVHRYQEQ